MPPSRARWLIALVLCALALPAVVPAFAAAADEAVPAGPFTIAETGRHYARLQEAVDAIGTGRGTIRIAPGEYHDCAVQAAGEVSYLAIEPGTAVLFGTVCEDKAALVLRGRMATVRGLVFARLASSDGTGAGIRLEQGDLTVQDSWFRDSQQGLLTGSDPAGRIALERNRFSRLGTCESSAGCAHSVYVGGYAWLTVTACRFEEGTGGHYLKSRAARIVVRDSQFDDSLGTGTSYMIDLADGATGEITGNSFVQGRTKENYSAFIAVAAEARRNASTGLAVAGNVAGFVPGLGRRAAFVADWSGAALALGDNRLGPGIVALERR